MAWVMHVLKLKKLFSPVLWSRSCLYSTFRHFMNQIVNSKTPVGFTKRFWQSALTRFSRIPKPLWSSVHDLTPSLRVVRVSDGFLFTGNPANGPFDSVPRYSLQ